MLKKIIVLCFWIPLMGLGQNTSIGTNEKLVFSASYNISGLLTDIAQVNMETSPVKTSSATLLRLKCTATTYAGFDSYFKIRDLYESYVSPSTLRPYLYKRDINEGPYNKFEQYKFGYKTYIAETITKRKKPTGNTEDKANVKFQEETRDIVSTIYNLRNFDFKKLSPGQYKKFNFLFDKKQMTINIKLLGTESVSTKLGKKLCYKLAITASNSDVLKGSNDNLLWLTADANKIPVLAKFKIPVGNGELKIVSATGLKN